MPIGDTSTKLMIMVICFSIFFPVFGYGLTFEGSGMSQSDMISENSLIEAGIDIGDSTSIQMNGTLEDGGWVTFTLTDFSYYVLWDNMSASAHRFYITRSSTLIPSLHRPMFTPPEYINNSIKETGNGTDYAILDNWDSNYNWTRASIRGSDTWLGFGQETDVEMFWTIPKYANGTDIYASLPEAMLGPNTEVVVTLGRSWRESDDVNLWVFVNWFTRLLTGVEDYGMPLILVWVLRVISMITLVVGAMVVIELIPL